MRSGVSISSRTLTIAEYVLALAAFWAISAGTNELTRRLHVPVPSNALAMLVTFALLTSGCIPLKSLDRGATLLVRHLSLFFVPFAVGIIALRGASTLLAPLAAIVLLSVGAGIATAAVTANAIRTRQVQHE